MMNKKVYLSLFYVCYIVTFIFGCFACKDANVFFNYDSFILLMPYINLVLIISFIVLTVLFIKKDIKASIICPIIYLVFVLIVYLLINHYFSDNVYSVYMLYYFKIILIGLLFVVLYTCLCFTKKNKVKKEH